MLAFLLSHADSPEPMFIEFELCVWAQTPWDRIPVRQFFRQAENASVVSCPSCQDGHSEEVVLWRNPDGSCRPVIPCPESLYVEIRPEQLRQWTIDFDALASAVATALALGGERTVLVPGRLWRLGRTKWAGVKRDVVFACGLTGPDTANIVGPIGQATRPIVFVGTRVPAPGIWPGRVPPVLALAQFSTLRDGRLEMDHEAICSAITEAESAAASRTSVFTVEQLKDVVRQQLKAEDRNHPPDEVFAEAYRREGSLRKAAKLLSQQTGREITKDQVQFAVRRLGGPTAVVRDRNSDSIVRSAAPQYRDRRGKRVNAVQPREP